MGAAMPADIPNSSSATGDPIDTDEWFGARPFTILLGLLIFLTFPLVLLGQEAFYFRDYGVLAYPFIHLHREAFWSGELPLWNVLSNCGAPFLAQWGTLVLYPFSLIYLLLPLPWSLSLFSMLHLYLGGIGMYFLARNWFENRFASSVAGIGFTFAGISLSSMMWPNYLVALGWLPWIVILGQRSFREPRRWIPLAAIAGGLQMLSGVPEIILMTWIVLAGLGLIAVLEKDTRWSRAVWVNTLLVVLVSGLALAQLLPFFELLSLSQRDFSFATTKWSMPWWGWANLVAPLFHAFTTTQGMYVQEGQEFFVSYYPSLIVLTLALASLWYRRTPKVTLLLILALLSLLLAPGEQSFLYNAIRKAFPAIGIARYTVKALVLLAFVLPLAAAWLIAQLPPLAKTKTWTPLRPLIITYACLFGAALGVLWVAKLYPLPYDNWRLTAGNTLVRLLLSTAALGTLLMSYRADRAKLQVILKVATVCLLWVDLAFHWPHQNPRLGADVYQPDLAQIEPAPKPGQERVFILPWAEDQLLRHNVPDWRSDFLGRRLALWSNLNVLEGYPKVNGSSTLQVREQADVQSALYAEPHGVYPGLMDFLSVSWMTSSNNPTKWQRRSTHLPWITAGQQPLFVNEETVSYLTNRAFDPRKIVYLPEAARRHWQSTNAAKVRLENQSFQPHEIRLTADAPEPSVLVVAQSFYPGWKAFIDDQPVPLWRANHAFQAVALPQGRHEVRLTYVDGAFRLGAWISGLTLLLCVAWTAWVWKRPSKRKLE